MECFKLNYMQIRNELNFEIVLQFFPEVSYFIEQLYDRGMGMHDLTLIGHGFGKSVFTLKIIKIFY